MMEKEGAAQVGKLIYDLEDPDARGEFHRAVSANKAFLALWDISAWLRQKDRYSETGPESWEKVRSDILELIFDAGVDLEEYQ